MNSFWWEWSGKHNLDEKTYYIIYTENLKIQKETKLKPFAWYYNQQSKLYAIQFKTLKNTKEQKELFKKLGIKIKNKIRN
jgi:hypothetical protein